MGRVVPGASGLSPLYDVKKTARADAQSGIDVLFAHGCDGLGGASRDRTGDLKLAKLALSQLSYGPGSVTSDQFSMTSASLPWPTGRWLLVTGT